MPRSSASRALGSDLFCLILLAAVGIVVRLPTLPVRVFNVDEAQYEARAAYLLTTGRSAFEVTHGAVWTSALFGQLARWFGAYCTEEVRALVVGISIAMAWLIFALVRQAANRWWGLAAGTAFLLISLLLGGQQANREWFAMLPILAGWWLYQLSWNRSGAAWAALVYGAGLAVGLSVLAKFQSVPLCLAIPLLIGLDALGRRAWRGPLVELCVHGLGGATAALVYLAGFVAHGTLADHMSFVFGFKLAYSDASQRLVESPWMALVYHFLMGFRSSGLAALAIPLAVGSLATALVRTGGRAAGVPALVADRTTLLVSCGLLTAVVAISIGLRLFDHYDLYLAPQIAILGVLGLAVLFNKERFAWGLALATLAMQLCHLLIGIGMPIPSWLDENAWLLQVSAVGVAWAAFYLFPVWPAPRSAPPAEEAAKAASARAPTRRWLELARPAVATAIVVLLWIQTARTVAGVAEEWQVMRDQGADYNHFYRDFSDAAGYLQALAAPDRKLFVWGWRPELYSLSGLVPATRFVICQYLVDPVELRDGTNYTEQMRELLLQELRSDPPEIICDASRIGPGLADKEHYRLEDFPALAQFLGENYLLVRQLDKVDIYVARGSELSLLLAPPTGP